jgi:membrane-associated protease RseP (regulator of RpoE activity)
MLSKRVRLYLALVLALIAVATTVNFAFASNSAADGQSGNSVNATKAATMAASAAPTLIANFPLCQPPTPTPAPTATKGAPATKAATMAATVAAPAATMAATMAPMAMTMAATMAPTKVATPVATMVATVAPTATPIQIGKKPAEAGARVVGTAKWLTSKGGHCLSVAEITAGGPADVAGIQAGDLVLGFDKDALKDPADFYAHVSKHLSGDVVTITVQRGTKAMSLKVTLGLNPFIQ